MIVVAGRRFLPRFGGSSPRCALRFANLVASAATLVACGSTGEDFLFALPNPSPPAPAPVVCSGPSSVLVTPLQTGIGGTGELHAQADTQAVSFSWSGTKGVRVSNSNRPDALFTCVAPGSQTLTLVASGPGACITQYDVPINCVGS